MLSLKQNQPQLLDWARYLMRFAADELYEHEELRSGWLWQWRVRVSCRLPAEMRFPGLQQVIEVRRWRVHKATGQVIDRTSYFLSSDVLSARTAHTRVRRRWGNENKSHHPRDTVFAEDACRTRRGAQAFAALRNLLIALLHPLDETLLRSVRRFQANPQLLLDLLLQGT